MKIQRRFTQPGVDPLDTIEWDRRSSVIREPDGTVVFEMHDIEVPKAWSQVATDILAQKYFRKAGVPQPDGSLGRETSARQVVRRLAGCWTDWGRRYKYFDSDEDAATFDAEISHMLINQMAAPNSPQWFNTGLAYAYGITGPSQGHYFVDPDTKELTRAKDSYTHPQPHACFIQSVEDDLVNDNGIMDLWVREARLFKYGSGCISARAFVPIAGRGLVRLGDLFEEVSRHRPVVNFDGKGRFVNVRDMGLKTLALDKKSGRIVEDPIELVWSYDVPKEDKITVSFDSGARATVSAWHPFMVWDGREIVERRADQLIRGDAVIGPNSTTKRHIDNNSSARPLSYKVPWFHTDKKLEVLPDTDVAWLVGYFLGDGSLGWRRNKIERRGRTYTYRSLRLRFHDEDREPLERAAQILRTRFGASSSIARDGRGSKGLSLTCTKAAATAFFSQIVHVPGAKGASLLVPDFVKTGDSELQLAFLAGLIDSDGTVADGRASYVSECRSFVEEVAAMASLLGLGGGIVKNGNTFYTAVVRRSTSVRRAQAVAKHLVTPKHVAVLQDPTRENRRHNCMPIDADLGERIFPERDRYGLHGVSGGERFHVGRLVYEGIVNPAKILAAIAAKPEEQVDAELERVRHVAEGVTFVTDVAPCIDDVPFNDLTTRNTNTYLAGERGFVVIHNTGTNFSNLRAEGEKLSGGGTSSGLMSFLRVGDRAAGAIKSGGTTRRAAKMVILDMDHPDIEKFINWKVEEEKKVAALIAAGYQSSYEGDAYQTVSGQNSNNSVRVPDKFIDAVRKDETWDLLWRRDKSVARTVRARDLWDQIARAAWSCADPGVQYDDIINSWHTCPAGGRIRATNPCGEYQFLDDTACNLASINLMKFYDSSKSQFDVESYLHAIRLWTIVLEISVLMAQFPSPQIARKSYEYRTLGLGYANLGTLLMVSGIPYDSPRALAITGALSAMLTGESYATSAEMARDLGPFPRYKENAESMLRVMRNHRRAAYNATAAEYEDLAVIPMGIDPSLAPPYLLAAARDSWDRAVALGEQHGYRNAQATCIAPTGCLVGGSMVITDRGLMRLNRLGDTGGAQWQQTDFSVLTDEGERTATKFYVNGVEATRRITTRAGYSIQGTLAHRIKVVNPNTGDLEWKRFADVQENDIVALSMSKLVGKPRDITLPPLSEEYWTGDYTTQVPRNLSPELAELIGYFMGDGSLHSKGLRFRVSAEDSDVVDRLCHLAEILFNLTAHIAQKQGYVEVAFHSVPLTQWWEACGFTKRAPSPDHSGKGYLPHIPDAVLATNDPAIYGSFLRGLFEADGTVLSGVPSWTTAHREFADDVRTLMLALGLPTTTKLDISGWGQSTLHVLRLLNSFYLDGFMLAIGFLGTRKTTSVRSAADRPQAMRRDRVHLAFDVIKELVPAGSVFSNVVEQSMKRNGGAISRRTALQLHEQSEDPRLKASLGFFYDTIATNEDGGEQFTYDLSVPSNVTYVANGFISHNTIGLIMDCDTTGIEPDFALVKFKKLSGGGYFKIINQSIPEALRNLGYTQNQVDDIIRYAKGSGSLYGAPYVNAETLKARGFTDEDIAKVDKALPSAFEIGFAFNQFTLGEPTMRRLGFTPDQYNMTDFDLLHSLGFSREEEETANNYICGTMTIEGAPHLKEEHYAAFDCANKCGKLGRRFIHHMGHVRVMAAAQPFICGGISKTCNLPNEATVDEIKETYMRSWELGIKAIALYRDGSKLSQPLSNKGSDKTAQDDDKQLALSEEFAKQLEAARKQRAEELRPDEILAAAQRILANTTSTDFKRQFAKAIERNRLPAKRRGWTQKAKISGHTVFLRTGEYADGTLGEIFVDLHKEGASFRSLTNCFAIAVSIGLQYGVPLEEFVDKFIFTRFEPNGFVDHPNIKHCTSIIDYIFRVLGMEYLGRTDFVQVKPEDRDVDATNHDDVAQAEFEAHVAAQQATDETPEAPRKMPSPRATGSQHKNGSGPSGAQASSAPAIMDPTLAAQLAAVRSREAQMASMMGDAPLCDVCGSITRRNGACYVCDSCGRSMGCS